MISIAVVFYLCYWREDISVLKCWKFNIILFCHFKIILYILWWTLRSIVECILFRNVLSNLNFFTFEFQLQTLWDTVYESNIMLLFAVVKLQVIYYFRCTLCQHLNSFLTSLPLFSQNMAFIFYKLFVLLNCFPIP